MSSRIQRAIKKAERAEAGLQTAQANEKVKTTAKVEAVQERDALQAAQAEDALKAAKRRVKDTARESIYAITIECVAKKILEEARQELRLEQILHTLRTKKTTTGKGAEALKTLVSNLEEALDTYMDTKDKKTASSTFIETCSNAMNAAMPNLENDLGWGDYLKNMLKQLANVVGYGIAKITTFGFYSGDTHTFFNKNSFAISESAHATAAQEAMTALLTA